MYGGSMDSYYERVYKLNNGKMVEIANGKYGAEDNSNVEFDSDGNPIYQYFWNGTKITKTEYEEKINKAYDKSNNHTIDEFEWFDEIYLAYEALVES